MSGRREALRVLDSVLADAGIQATLETAIRAAFNKDPVAFFKSVVMPLLPAETKLSIAQDGGVVKWQSLLDTMPQTPEQVAAHDALVRANIAAEGIRAIPARKSPTPTPSR